jgi:hexosaminidase
LTTSSQIGHDASSREIASVAAASLRALTHLPLPLIDFVPSSGVYFALAADLLRKGEYSLDFASSVAYVRAANRTGFFYGLQTLLQLLPSSAPFVVGNNSIRDFPRFQWRGILLDVSRHFFNTTTVRTVLDSMARYKLNVLHWHLTDDQGWRIESRKFPKLTEVGSIRSGSPVLWDRERVANKSYGPFFYTQAEVRSLVSYAREREITIVPEIEMPGHAVAALAAYPELGCRQERFSPRTLWGISTDVYCPGNDETLRFLEQLLDEVLELFDSEFIHVGGDECPHARWEQCPKCRARMEKYRLRNTGELQSWFIGHFADYLAKRGRRLIGWDEILEGGLPKGATVMSWRGIKGGEKAASLGHQAVMTPSTFVYLDYYQFGADDTYEYIGNFLPLKKVYTYEPAQRVPAKFIIGVQGNVWTEHIHEPAELEWKLFPRAAAIAETGWTRSAKKNWNRFMEAIARTEVDRLRSFGINAAPLAIGKAAGWTAGEIPTEWITKEWDVTGALGTIGKVEIAFIFFRGANGLKVKDVRLFVAGLLSGADGHEGLAFDPPKANVFAVFSRIPAIVGKVVVTAKVRCVGGSDSVGNIYVYAVSQETL